MLSVKFYWEVWMVPGCTALAVIALGTVLMGQADGGLYYWQNFDGGDGVADVTPGGGDLAVRNTGAATTAFTGTGGIFGGSYDATTNPAIGSAGGIASTAVAGGTAIDLTGITGQLTISMWVKVQTFTNVVGFGSRLFILGSSGTTDIFQSNTLGFAQLTSDGAFSSGDGNGTKFLAYLGGGASGDLTSAGGVGVVNNVDEWTFIAFSYDGTSSFGNDSVVQLAATGSSINGQFYRGTDTAAVVRSPLSVTSVAGDATQPSMGILGLGNNGVLLIGNRQTSATGGNQLRGFDGWIDDVRIYDSVLSAAEVEGVRQAGLLGAAAAVPGDFDGDGDGADFVVWQTNFPAAGGHTRATGDADNDGDVDGADFVVWQTNFPFTPGPGVASMPEPGACALFALAIPGLVRMTRRFASKLSA